MLNQGELIRQQTARLLEQFVVQGQLQLTQLKSLAPMFLQLCELYNAQLLSQLDVNTWGCLLIGLHYHLCINRNFRLARVVDIKGKIESGKQFVLFVGVRSAKSTCKVEWGDTSAP